ncbi:MAG TPA: putative glycoside hydrolase, partial [Cellvibrionaceae bacterium]
GYVADKAALMFDMKVDQAPTETTYLRLGCGSYCASDIDVTEGMRDHMAGKGWQSISVDLNCFPAAGANFGVQQPQEEFITQVLRPFQIYTTGELDLTFANVRLEKFKADTATLNCQK